jgi:hypothetical protein
MNRVTKDIQCYNAHDGRLCNEDPAVLAQLEVVPSVLDPLKALLLLE